VYTAPENDKDSIKAERDRLRDEVAVLRRRLQSLQGINAADTLDRLQGDDSDPANNLDLTDYTLLDDDDDEETFQGRMLQDDGGNHRYLGESSGATFLDHMKEFMTKLVPYLFSDGEKDGNLFTASVGRYQTFDSRPLPKPDVDPLWLPKGRHMLQMLNELNEHIQQGKEDLVSGGIFWWGDLHRAPSPRTSTTSHIHDDSETHRDLVSIIEPSRSVND